MPSHTASVPDAARRLAGAPSYNLLPAHRRLILCVDDDVVDLMLRSAILQSGGYDALTARSGPDGLSILNSTIVDAVTLDYEMPDMNGEAVAVAARGITEVPIIVVSGRPACELPRRLLMLTDGYVEKGSSPRILLRLLEQLLRAPVSGDM